MSKFKVGDIVRGTCEVEIPYILTTKEMTKGEVISEGDSRVTVKILEHTKEKGAIGNEYIVRAKFLKHYNNGCSTHITQDESTVHAVLKDGSEIVKHSKAVCSPDDTFDFPSGAKIAFDRLICEQKHESEEPHFVHKPPRKKGDRVLAGDDIPVDTMLTVWDVDGIEFSRHFSYFNANGKIMGFVDGKTSKQTGGVMCWLNAALAEDLPKAKVKQKLYFSKNLFRIEEEILSDSLPEDHWSYKFDGRRVKKGYIKGTEKKVKKLWCYVKGTDLAEDLPISEELAEN